MARYDIGVYNPKKETETKQFFISADNVNTLRKKLISKVGNNVFYVWKEGRPFYRQIGRLHHQNDELVWVPYDSMTGWGNEWIVKSKDGTLKRRL